MSLTLLLLLSHLSSPLSPPTPEDWLIELKTQRLGVALPKSIVMESRDFGPSTAISLYEQVEVGPDGKSDVTWTARREIRRSGEASVDWTSSRSCDGLQTVVTAFERTPLPRIEMRSARALGADASPRPVMGAIHQAHVLWTTAWDSENAPVEMTLSSLGSGPAQRLYEIAATSLSACWTSA